MTGHSEAQSSAQKGEYWPIEQYLAIGDLRTVALIAPDGGVDWLCLPQFDSPSVFARLLDSAQGGVFQVQAQACREVTQRYRDGTNVVDTVGQTATGTWVMTDWMSPYPALQRFNRRVEVTAGTVTFEARIAPRPQYGHRPGPPVREPDGNWRWATPPSLYIWADVPLVPDGDDLVATLTLTAGTVVRFGLGLDPIAPEAWRTSQDADLQETVNFWRAWCGACAYAGTYAAAIDRSALTLKLLTFAPTGAVVAAATTSLPEDPGGQRNWDYRYTWLRDASMTLTALDWLGHPEESRAFFRWMLGCCTAGHFVLHPVSAGGVVTEWEHPTWTGYGGAHPVRIGNAAAGQQQLDVYGEVLEAAWQHFQRDPDDCDSLVAVWPFLATLAEEAAARWTEPDEGIWETRGGRAHFTYSKAQCWVALDRAVRLAGRWELPGPVDHWRETAKFIRDTVLDQGYNPVLGSFVQTLGGTTLDASCLLLLPQLGIIEAGDPRMRDTVTAIRTHLAIKGDPDRLFLYRYRDLDDGVAGSEHAFLLCSTWLIGTLALAGDLPQARRLLDRLLGIAPYGVYAEEYDPATGRFWGNFPQAFTQLGIITAILHLEHAQTEMASRGPLTGCRGWPAPEAATTKLDGGV
ncbi:MAG: glycoside hydrolase family 15 protein [Thermaerobacter sp.]|nr:glycoside hydrolase family 15 protein [Thermaerobacter sp.]